MPPIDDHDPAYTPTVAARVGSFEPTVGGSVGDAPAPHASLTGYQLGATIGRGGMGEVVVAHDERIGRDIAIKRMRGDAPDPAARARFLREARIQARLEHPAIVPVHEVGHDADGQPYFTMKRLAGVTLAAQLASAAVPPRQRLLRWFGEVCRAVAFAHARGVVHRDLKPDNIMLGEFGEVYVLDWGLARVRGEVDGAVHSVDVESLDGMTQAGAVLGTPGYMAPEQVEGAADVDAPADVYALGSILFEILAGERLHPRGNAAMLTTIAGIDGSPTTRRPERGIAPELDALTVAALAQARATRPSARELAERVERYLEGDRDVERRRELAATWLAQAQAALRADPVGRRAEAVHAAGRALALDPESRDAAELVTRLMIEPAPRLPAELERELADIEGKVQRRQSRVAMMSFIAFPVFIVMASWSGLRSVALLAALSVVLATMAASAYRLTKRRATRPEMFGVVIGNAALAALMSRVFGPLIIAPSVTCVMAVSLTSYPQLIDRARYVIGILAASWLVPCALETMGVIPSTWHVETGAVVSTSSLVEVGGSTAALLIVANVIVIVVIGLFANALARSRRDAQRLVEIQAWHLRQLLPVRT